MNVYKAGNSHADAPVAPWVASPVKAQSTERLLQHDAHLNSITIYPVAFSCTVMGSGHGLLCIRLKQADQSM
jgi:hypothetical protein